MARRRRMGLPPPQWIGHGSRSRRKRRAPIMLALLIHSLLGAVVVIVLSTARTLYQTVDVAMSVEFVAPLDERPKPTRRLKRLVRSAQASPASPDWQRMASQVPQAMQLATSTILDPADPYTPDMSTRVDLVTTAAKARTDDRSLVLVRSLSSKPTPGQGAVAGIQRPQGQGGRHPSDSSGAAEVGLEKGKVHPLTSFRARFHAVKHAQLIASHHYLCPVGLVEPYGWSLASVPWERNAGNREAELIPCEVGTEDTAAPRFGVLRCTIVPT